MHSVKFINTRKQIDRLRFEWFTNGKLEWFWAARVSE